eukprot:5708767-Prymnesium_polylepis.1
MLRREREARSGGAFALLWGAVPMHTPEGALEVLREERCEWQRALNGAVKVAKGATFMSRWLTHSTAAPTAE